MALSLLRCSPRELQGKKRGGSGTDLPICMVVSVVMFVVVAAAGRWGWKVACGDSGFDGAFNGTVDGEVGN